MPHNYQLSAQLVLKDIYRLVSIITADSEFLALGQAADDPLRTLREWFMEDEIIHGLVSIAVSNRIQLDHLREDRNGPDREICGDLQEDVLEGAWTDLTFREACNKIIHAVHIVPETQGDPAEEPLSTSIKLRGMKGEQAWQARLDLISFARSSVKNFKRLA